jgi:UDP-glucose 4-epimerase
MSARRVLITGGAGFVGSHLVEALLEQDSSAIIVIADNFFLGHERNLRFLATNDRCFIERVDISSQSALFSLISKFKINQIWNLAVVPLPTSLLYPEWTIQNNINCALAVCEAARFFEGLKIINISSSETYGTAKTIPMKESHPLSPETPYAASKAASDLIFESYSSTFGLNFLTLRPFNMFGPRQNRGSYAGVVPIFIDKINKREEVIVYGDGNQTRDFIFVKDSVGAMLKAESKWNGDESVTLNIATGKETSVNELLKMISSSLNLEPIEIKYLQARDGDVMRHCGDSTLFVNFTGTTIPEISTESLFQTIDWYSTNVD